MTHPGARGAAHCRALPFAILVHRYLGMAIGIVVALWCLSGFVMMYVQYPEYTDAERVAGIAPLDADACCAGELGARLEEALAYLPLESFRIESRAGRPLVRLRSYFGERAFDLETAEPLEAPSDAEIAEIGHRFAEHYGIGGEARYLGTVEQDQWTVYGVYNAHRPLHKFAADDGAGSQWYVSSATGDVVQITTARERFWSWLGSVPHWLYFTELRRHPRVWAQLVIWLSIVALFLTTLGIYIGIARLGRRRNGRLSPYRGWALWHHHTGLVFGLLALTWLASGLFSMNPWGALEGRSFALERERLRGGEIVAAELLATVAALGEHPLPGDTVRLDSSLINGELSLVAWQADGGRVLLDAERLAPIRLGVQTFEAAAANMRPGVGIVEQSLLSREDAYYFSHHETAALPVYRIVYTDGERIYLDTVTGAMAYAADAAGQRYRWLFAALHRGDFAALLRTRPLWDAFLLPLLLGVTVSAVTGSWLGLRRLARRAGR